MRLHFWFKTSTGKEMFICNAASDYILKHLQEDVHHVMSLKFYSISIQCTSVTIINNYLHTVYNHKAKQVQTIIKTLKETEHQLSSNGK